MDKKNIIIAVLAVWCVGVTFYALGVNSGSHMPGGTRSVSSKEAKANMMEALEKSSKEKGTGKKFRATSQM